MRESHFQKKIVKLLRDKGCWVLNVHGERMQKRGVPDLLVIGLGWKGFLEIKVGNNKCTEIQKVVMKKIERRNFAVYVLRYDEKLDAIQIENWKGEMLNLVAWTALWDWLKKPIMIVDHHYPVYLENKDLPISTVKTENRNPVKGLSLKMYPIRE